MLGHRMKQVLLESGTYANHLCLEIGTGLTLDVTKVQVMVFLFLRLGFNWV